ncbi:MAG: HlyD family efflux transporter periplasmic adaptor subunit [Thermodesulfovibrionia bacterium]
MRYKIAIVILIVAVIAAFVLYKTSPETKKTIPKRPVPLVQTAEVRPGREKVYVEAFGTVVPAQRIMLQSEVEGRIIGQNPELIPGGLINKDDVVIQIDPVDYELRIKEYMAEMEEAMFELELEQGRQVIASREWELLERDIKTSESGKSLALREPHLRLVKAKVEKARSRLAAAELAKERTTIRSPYNALVLEEFIDKGQLVSRQTPLATLVGTGQFWVQVSMPVSVLPRITFPGAAGQQGSEVHVIFEPVSGKKFVRSGYVLRLMGDLDPEARMARILIVIDDPLNLHADSQSQQDNKSQNKAGVHGEGRILLGSYVKVKIDAGFFDNVYSIPRRALREGDVVWIKDDEDKLQIRHVRVVWRLKDKVLVNADLKDSDKLILSRLQSPLPGIEVRSVEKSKDKRRTNP